MATTSAIIESVLRCDRAITISALGLAIALAWAYLLLIPMPDDGMGGMVMMEPMAMPWSADYATLMAAMWAVMMAAMMLPSAAPTILLVTTLARRQEGRGMASMRAGFFALGYLAVWSTFSLTATALQWWLDQAAMLTGEMKLASSMLIGAVFVAAGLYEWTPLKRTCLSHCRSPLAVIMQHWRPGAFGAFRTGAANGLYCVGCCAVLMALLFAGGVMNLVWVAGITVLVLVEKLAPHGEWLARGVGVALVLWGGVVIVHGVAA